MLYAHCGRPLSTSYPKHFILTVRLPLTMMSLTISILMLIPTLTIRHEFSFVPCGERTGILSVFFFLFAFPPPSHVEG